MINIIVISSICGNLMNCVLLVVGGNFCWIFFVKVVWICDFNVNEFV